MQFDQSGHRLVLHTSDGVKVFLHGCGSHGPFEIENGDRAITLRNVDWDIDYPYWNSLDYSEEPIERFGWIKNNPELTERQKNIKNNRM